MPVVRRAALPPLLAAVLLSPPLEVAAAQGWVEPERPPERPSPGGVTRVSSDVRVTVDGRVARVEVRERFRNDGAPLAEASYLYPLPPDAAFQNFSLWMGEQEIRGEVMSAEQARGIYEEIVRRRRDPALLTLAGHGLIRARVFPIQTGETRAVALRYTVLLPRAGDALRFRYALGNRGASGPVALRLTVDDPDGFGAPFSPTHHLEVERRGGRLTVALTAGSGGDVEILLPIVEHAVGASVVAHAPGGEDGYFMLLLSPSPGDTAAALARDVTFVVDVSGSMSGPKLEQARAALRQALGTLGARDRFRLIAFSSTVREFRSGLTPASRDALDAAGQFVDGLSAEGGTNIAGALDAALNGPRDSSRLSIVVFVTDGLPSVGEFAPDRIADRAGDRLAGARIFTIGLGHDVNTYLLDRLATLGRGTVEYVPPEGNVEAAVGAVTAKLRYPALVNLRVADAPVQLTELAPGALPDLFAGEELVVFGRYHGHGTGDLVLTGERNGRRERFAVRADFPEAGAAADYVPRLWASRRIGELSRQIRLEGGSPDLVNRVRELGLRYGILTDYTSYLVQEPELATRDPRRERPAAAPAPTTQTGGAAFDQARRSAKLSEARNLEAADAAAALPGAEDGPIGPGSARRTVAGRVFIRRAGVWTDALYGDSLQVTAVAAFSPAYFDLVNALPELAPWLALGDDVLIAGRSAGIRIASGAAGRTEWSPGQLRALTRAFRGV
jgi:Ca-activated chloride channel family protein